MMAKVIAMYEAARRSGGVRSLLHATHVPIAKKIPGLRHYEVTRGPIATLEGRRRIT